MRYGLVRAWAALAVALGSAAAADAGTEFAENLGWLGGAARDAHQETVFPVALAALGLTVALALFVACSRLSARDPLIVRMSDLRARAVEVLAALAGSVLCVVGMEAYETRFGGAEPFDPHGVILAHAPALAIAFVVTLVAAYVLLATAIGAAARAGRFAGALLATFFRRRRARSPRPLASRISTFARHARRLPPEIAGGACGFRAPPRPHIVPA